MSESSGQDVMDTVDTETDDFKENSDDDRVESSDDMTDDKENSRDFRVDSSDDEDNNDDIDGVYILRSIDFFFLATLRLIGVDLITKTKTFTIRCIPTPSHEASMNFKKMPPKEYACVDLTVRVQPGGGEPSDLDELKYNENCSLVGTLRRKTGTKQMLMATLAFASKKLEQTVFHFTDASHVLIDGQEISLRDYGLLSKGTTWYQRTFGAMPREDTVSEIKEYKLRLETIISYKQSIALIKVLSANRKLDDYSCNWYINIIKSSVEKKHTWKKMLQNIDLYGEGGSFFSFRVVENILATLQLGNTYKWKITMTPPEVYKYLVATRKIY